MEALSAMMFELSRDGTPCNITSPNTRRATLMQAAYNTLAGDHFKPQSPVCTPQRIDPTMMVDNFSGLCVEDQSFAFGPSPLDYHDFPRLYPSHPVISQSSPTQTLFHHQPSKQASSLLNMPSPDAFYSTNDSWQRKPAELNHQNSELESTLSTLPDQVWSMEHGTHSLQVEQSILIPSVDDYLSDSQPPITETEKMIKIKEPLATIALPCCKLTESIRASRDGATSGSKTRLKMTRQSSAGCIKEKKLSHKAKKNRSEPTSETKAQKEEKRRFSNNARERTRVKDMNKAFKELERLCRTHFHSDKAQTKLSILHQTVSIINSLKEQLKEQNVKAALIKVEDSGPNVPVQDPSLISNNANTSVELNTPQQFCSGSQIFEPQVDTSMNMISIGDAPTSSSNVNSLAVSASGQTKATSFLYNQQTLCRHKAASNERASRNCPTMLWTF